MAEATGRVARREFLRTAAGAGALFGPGRTGWSRATGMYLSLNWALIGGKAGWPEFARVAARTGYGGTDVDLGAAQKAGVESTRALFAELQIKASNANLPVNYTRDRATFERDLAGLDAAAQFAAAIECPTFLAVLPPAGPTPKAEWRKTTLERLTKTGEILQRSKIRLGLEFLGPLHFRTSQPHEYIWRMDETLAFAKECGPNVGLLLDVALVSRGRHAGRYQRGGEGAGLPCASFRLRAGNAGAGARQPAGAPRRRGDSAGAVLRDAGGDRLPGGSESGADRAHSEGDAG